MSRRNRYRVPRAMGALMLFVAGLLFVGAALAGATGDDAVTVAIVGCDGQIVFTSTKDLSNIIIEYADGSEIKLEDNDLSGTSHTTDYIDPVHGAIVKVWIHSGNNHNDNDPQPWNFNNGNSVGAYHVVLGPDCGTTTTTHPPTTYLTTTTHAPTTTYTTTTTYVTTTTHAPTTTYLTTTTKAPYVTTTTFEPEGENSTTTTTFINTEGATSTLPGSTKSTTTTRHVVVQGEPTSTTTVATGGANAAQNLPFTGGNSLPLALVGFALMAAGTLSVLGRRPEAELDE